MCYVLQKSYEWYISMLFQTIEKRTININNNMLSHTFPHRSWRKQCRRHRKQWGASARRGGCGRVAWRSGWSGRRTCTCRGWRRWGDTWRRGGENRTGELSGWETLWSLTKLWGPESSGPGGGDGGQWRRHSGTGHNCCDSPGGE